MGLRTPSPVTFTSAFLTTAGFAYIIPIFSAWAGACGTTAAGIGSGTDLSFSTGFIRTGAGSVITVVRRCTPAAAFGSADAGTVAVFLALFGAGFGPAGVAGVSALVCLGSGLYLGRRACG